MSEIRVSNHLENKDLAQTDLSKAAEKISLSGSEIGKSLTNADELTDDELNEPDR